MTKFIVRRAIGLIPALLIIITLSFFIIRVAPGGPFDQERRIPAEVMRNIERKYHLDESLLKQYGRYLLNVVRGDLGPSYRYPDHDVNYFIFTSLPDSLLLGSIALLLAVTLGLGVGMMSAARRNSWVDYVFMSAAVIGITVPLFVIGPVLMYIFAMKLHILPTSGWLSSQFGWKTLVMPVVTLTFPYFAYIARLSRASILEILRSDYVRTARAKGMRERTIMFKHVLKGGLLPVVSYLGPAFAAIVTGSVVVERIFRVPGLGQFFVQAAFNRDYTLLMGTVIVYSVILILMNFIVDIIYGMLDPRVSYS